MKKYIVDYSPLKKSLKKIPNHVVNKLLYWAKSVESLGLEEVRKYPGYHDEPNHDEPNHDEPNHDEPNHDEPNHLKESAKVSGLLGYQKLIGLFTEKAKMVRFI